MKWEPNHLGYEHAIQWYPMEGNTLPTKLFYQCRCATCDLHARKIHRLDDPKNFGKVWKKKLRSYYK